jgi:hypothetical protein
MKNNSLIFFTVALAIVASASTTHGRGFGGGGRSLSNNRSFDDMLDRRLSNFDGDNSGYGLDFGPLGGLPAAPDKVPRSYNPLAGEQAVDAPQVNVNAQRQSFVNGLAGMGIQTGGFRAGQFGPPPSANHAAADLRVQGNIARAKFRDYNVFGRDWYSQYPGAWYTRGYARSVWAAAAWKDVNAWLGGELRGYQYTYGKELTYENGNVCIDGRPIATAGKYYDSAAAIAQSGERANIPRESAANNQASQAAANWLPLGVFEAIPSGSTSSKMLFQLAVNKAGVIRGNYFDPPAKNMQLIQGAVDKDTERACWIVADRKNIIFDCVLYNLTKSEAPVLAHMGKDKKEQWVLVRLNQKPDEASGQ